MLSEEKVRLLEKHLPFWEKLSDLQRKTIIDKSNTYHYEKDTYIHNGESECAGTIFIVNGTLRTSIVSEEGREITLYRLYKNDICVLSASCVLKCITFDVSVVAETDCDVIQIGQGVYNRLMSENIYVECHAYRVATERFSDVMWAMQQILFTSFDKRLAAFLLDESDKLNSPSIKLTHEQIAKYMGSAREVVSRMLKYFSQEGLISYGRGQVRIISKDGLQQILDGNRDN